MKFGLIYNNNKQTKSPMLKFQKSKQKKISDTNRSNAAIFHGQFLLIRQRFPHTPPTPSSCMAVEVYTMSVWKSQESHPRFRPPGQSPRCPPPGCHPPPYAWGRRAGCIVALAGWSA